jgi:hypothetical protein
MMRIGVARVVFKNKNQAMFFSTVRSFSRVLEQRVGAINHDQVTLVHHHKRVDDRRDAGFASFS